MNYTTVWPYRPRVKGRVEKTDSRHAEVTGGPRLPGVAKEARDELRLPRRVPPAQLRVFDVALEIGCANPSHSARPFRRETGLSPRDYRRQR